jgi:hypothetical protein
MTRQEDTVDFQMKRQLIIKARGKMDNLPRRKIFKTIEKKMEHARLVEYYKRELKEGLAYCFPTQPTKKRNKWVIKNGKSKATKGILRDVPMMDGIDKDDALILDLSYYANTNRYIIRKSTTTGKTICDFIKIDILQGRTINEQIMFWYRLPNSAKCTLSYHFTLPTSSNIVHVCIGLLTPHSVYGSCVY